MERTKALMLGSVPPDKLNHHATKAAR